MNNSLFQSVFIGANNLRTLVIVGSRLTELPAHVFVGAQSMNQLYVVNCDVNQVYNTTFYSLNNLEVLDLSSNTNLVDLRLTGNALESLNTKLFERNFKLKKLNFENNRILSVTPWFDRKFDLEYVNLLKISALMICWKIQKSAYHLKVVSCKRYR